MNDKKLTVRDIARICHETNRAYCEALGYEPGETQQVPWEEAPHNIKQSAIDGVNFHLDHPEAGDSASHENWSKFKIADGWVYGLVKDAEKKTHPCLVPFSELPYWQQVKDGLFRSVVDSLRNMI